MFNLFTEKYNPNIDEDWVLRRGWPSIEALEDARTMAYIGRALLGPELRDVSYLFYPDP